MTHGTELVTARELMTMPERDARLELIRGVVHARPYVGWLVGSVVSAGLGYLDEYVRPRGVGKAVPRAGFWVERDPDTVIAPNFAMVAADRLARMGDEEQDFYFPGPPDVAGEVACDADPPGEAHTRVERGLAAGTRMVLLIDASRRTVAVHRPSAAPTHLTESDVLDGGAVVPGWRVPVRNLFARSRSGAGTPSAPEG